MGLETGTTIAQLDSSWPIGASDQIAQGDDHLRLIKSVLKSQFPGALGQGFNTPITAKESDLNSIFTTGVKCSFYMASAPTGWVLSNPGTNYTLVSAAIGGTVGGGAGRDDNIVSGCVAVPPHVHTQQGIFTSATENQSLSHSHFLGAELNTSGGIFSGASGGGAADVNRSGGTRSTTALVSPPAHNHNITISGNTTGAVVSGTSTTVDKWSPTYAFVIIASKS